MSPFTAHAQIVSTENVYGAYQEPTSEELEKIEAYREQYRQAFGEYPAGSHWIDSIKQLVSLLRPGGIT